MISTKEILQSIHESKWVYYGAGMVEDTYVLQFSVPSLSPKEVSITYPGAVKSQTVEGIDIYQIVIEEELCGALALAQQFGANLLKASFKELMEV